MINKRLLTIYMVKKDYTQKKLAEECGISKNTLNSKINGRGSFDTNLIDKICDKLEITKDIDKVKIFLSGKSQNRDDNYGT